jgi:hypothetical protein
VALFVVVVLYYQHHDRKSIFFAQRSEDFFTGSERVRAIVRPQAIRLARPGEPLEAGNLFRGEVRFGAYLGVTARYEVAVKDLVFIVDVPDPRPGALYTPGDQVQLGFAAESVLLLEEG